MFTVAFSGQWDISSNKKLSESINLYKSSIKSAVESIIKRDSFVEYMNSKGLCGSTGELGISDVYNNPSYTHKILYRPSGTGGSYTLCYASFDSVRGSYSNYFAYGFNRLYVNVTIPNAPPPPPIDWGIIEEPDPECKKDYSKVEVQFGKALSAYQELVAKYNRYAKLLILDSEYDERVVDECNKRILQLAYYSLGNERIRWKFAMGWANVAFGDWKGRLNISVPNQFFFNSSVEILNSETNDWEIYTGDKNILELDFDNIVKESDSRDYLEAISKKLDELKTKGCSFTDSDTNVVVPLGITTAMFTVGEKTLSIKQLLNLDYMYANNSIGEIGNISNAFEGIYTELPSMTSEILATLGTGIKNVIKTVGGKFFIPFLAISSELDAPAELDLFEPTQWVEENEELIKTGDFEGLANTIQVVGSKLIQELSSISQAVQNVAESTSQAIAKELQEVEMKVQPITIEENSKLGIDTSSLETSKVVIDPTALMEVLKSQGILIDTTKLAETLVTSKLLIDSSGLADNKIGVDASSLDNATIKANVTGALTIADGQTIDSNMILDEQTKSAIKAQGDFAIAQKVLEEARAQREIDKEERDKVAHEKKYSEGGLVDLQTENATSVKNVVFDDNLENITSSEGETSQARRGVLTGLKDVGVFDVINEMAINVTGINLANVAQVRSKEEEEDDNDEKLNIFEKVFLNFVTDINDDFIKANMPPFLGDIAELLKRGDN